MLQFIGFDDKDDRARGGVMEAWKLISAAKLGVTKKDKKALAAITKWFGATSAAELANISLALQRMDWALGKAQVQISYNLGCGASDNAVCYPPSYGWDQLAGLDQIKAAGSQYRISFCPRLFKMTWGGTKAKPLTSGGHIQDQNFPGTIVHEFSHMIIGTDDVITPGTTAKAYGVASAQSLANNHPNDAKRNAENWGFFCCEFQ